MKFKKICKRKHHKLAVFLILLISFLLFLNCVKHNKKNETVLPKDSIEFEPPKFIPYEPSPLEEKFRYPDSLKYLGIEGKVILKLHINKKGEVAKAIVEKALHPAFDSIAVRDVRTIKFGRTSIKPVDITVLFPVEFKLEKK
jgi:TonB family protein